MSDNFKENFFRDEENTLDYDDSAFYYFFISILTVLLIPYTIHLLKTMMKGEVKIEHDGLNCQCSICKENFKKRKQANKKTWMRAGFFFKLSVGIALWYLWYLTAVQISNLEPLKSFDPFQILGVETDADAATIKKAYRKLSLLKHPDKNPDDPLAISEFIQITKAYTALTDETARANWEKYGNPDGPGNFHVAVALPRFLLEKENQVQVLGCFFFILLVVVPMFFYFNLDQSQFDVGGVLIENRKIYSFLLNENLILKNCPALLAHSLEFNGMRAKSKEQAILLQKIRNDDQIKEKELIPKQTNKIGKNTDMKSLCLILGHVLKIGEVEDKELKEDLLFILSKAPFLINMMIEVCIQIAMDYKFGRQRVKRTTPRNVIFLVNFCQNLVQGSWGEDEMYMQLPHMTPDKLRGLKKQIKGMQFSEYCNLAVEDRQKYKVSEDPTEQQDIEEFIKVFPKIDVKVEFFVDGEEDIMVGDFVTYRITITLKNVEEGQKLGFIHSNRYPFLKQSQWYLLFLDHEEQNFLKMEKYTLKERVTVLTDKQRVMQPGHIKFLVLLKNDSYKGCDKIQPVSFEVKKYVERSTQEYNQDDLVAIKTPSMMQAVMDMNAGDSDDDEEESEDESPKKEGKEKEDLDETQESKKDR